MYNRNELELENDKFVKLIQVDKEQYLSLLSTMARFHKYNLKQQIGLCLHAPKSFTAVATAEQWEKFYGRSVLENAVGIPLSEDASSENEFRMVFDVEDTYSEKVEEKSPDLLWRYNDKYHKRLIDDVMDGEAETPEKIISLCRELAKRSHLPTHNLVATTAAYVVLSRLGYEPHLYMNRELESIRLKGQDVEAVLSATNELSKRILNPIGSYIKNERRELDEQQYENPLLRSLGKIEGRVHANRAGGEISGDAGDGGTIAVPAKSTGAVQQELFGFSGSDDGDGGRDGGVKSTKLDGMGRESQQHSGEGTGDVDGGDLPVNLDTSRTGSDGEDVLVSPERDERDKINEKVEVAIRGLSKHFGMDEGALKQFISLQLNDSNINEYGRFDKLKNAVDKTKAKEYFEKMEGEEIKPFRVNMKIDTLLRNFIVDGILPTFDDVPIVTQVEQSVSSTGSSGENLKVNPEHEERIVKGGFKKQVFQKNLDAIRLLKRLESEDREAVPEERVVLQGYAGFGGLPDAFDESVVTWKNEYQTLKEILTIHVNSYFLAHPEDVMGTLEKKSTAYGFDVTCKPSVEQTLEEQLNRAFAGLSKQYQAFDGEMVVPSQIMDSAIKRPFSFFYQEGKLYYQNANQDEEITELSIAQKEQVRACIQVREMVRSVIESQKNDESDMVIQGLQRQFNEVYDSYVGKYGRIGEDKSFKKIFEQDASYPLLCSLEIFKEGQFVGKSDIFSKRTITPYVVPESADTAADALMISMQEKGKVDLGYMMGLTGIGHGELVRQLEYTSIYYDIEKKEYQLADEYLSGDIRGKIEYLEKLTLNLQEQRENVLREMVTPWAELLRYDPKNEIESNLLTKMYPDIHDRAYFREHAGEDREFALAVLGKAGSYSNIYVPKQYEDDPLFMLQAYKYGRAPTGYSDGEKLLKKICKEIEPDMSLYGPLTSEDAALYNFLEMKFTKYHHDTSDILVEGLKEEWEQYKAAIEERKETIVTQGQSEAIQDIGVQLELIQKNLTVLESVKPKDLQPSEIQIELGATWIPTDDVKQFLVETLNMGYGAKRDVEVHYSSVSGNWKIDGKTSDSGNPKAEMTYGLSAMNAYQLTELALNLKEAKIHKTIYVDGNEKRVVDKEATILAQQKQEMLKTEFSQWIWKDPERRERIAGFYNRHFNNIRPREYSGKYLTFPGMNSEIRLRDHQKDAIAHTLYGGNTLLAHCVGAGKTYEMVASIMEAKRLGISKKAMVVVPKHLTEQFGAEFLQLYPSANILVATQKDFETANRKEFCSKIATRDWDAVVMGYTQFEKIPMSHERKLRILTEEIDGIIKGIDQVKSERGERFTIKQMEIQRQKLQGRLASLQVQNTDQTLVFEDLGIDRLYVDEAHYYKNLYTYTKMQNIPGISTTDAQKTMDMFEKCQYLNEITNEKGIVFATGTPISNSMTELFTMQRYLQPSRLESSGLNFFDSWASTFGKTVTAIELSPEGKGFRSKTRFAKFHNLPELMSMFKEIADIKTADMLKLPVPEVERIINRIAATEDQEYMVDQLAERAERIRSGSVSSDEDNMLLIINEGRKLALDQRLIDPSLPDNPDSKVNQCVTAVYDTYESTKDKKSTQLVFCDLSTPTYGKGFSVYDDIKAKLVAKGIAEKEIAFIHDAKNEKQKDQLFTKVRSGAVRVLLGSTAMMGTGTNVQDKLIALHDLDVPWRPSDLEQRGGRIVRQGNENSNVKIRRYVTEGTFDAYLWQIIENKQRFISQIMTSKTPVRAAEDVDEATLSYAEIKAIATGNPLIKEKMDLDIQLEKLKMAKSAHLSNQHRLEHLISDVHPEKISLYEDTLRRMQEDVSHARKHTRQDHGKEAFSIVLNGKRYTERKEAGAALLEAVKDKKTHVLKGEYRGMNVSLVYDISQGKQMMVLSHALTYRTPLGDNGAGNMTRLDHLISNIPDEIKQVSEKLERTKENFESAKVEVNVAFSQEEEMKEKLLRVKELETLLNLDAMSEVEKANEKERRIQSILDSSASESEIERVFKEIALSTLRENNEQWEASYDQVIGVRLIQDGYSKEDVVSVLFKFSPEVSGREELQSFVETIGTLPVVLTSQGAAIEEFQNYMKQFEDANLGVKMTAEDEKNIVRKLLNQHERKEVVGAIKEVSPLGGTRSDERRMHATKVVSSVEREMSVQIGNVISR